MELESHEPPPGIPGEARLVGKLETGRCDGALGGHVRAPEAVWTGKRHDGL